jgi:NAD+ kinase
MRAVGLVARPGHEAALGLARKLVEWLQKQGVTAAVDDDLAQALPMAAPLGPEDYGRQDLVVVLGGDGTLLRAAGRVGLHDVPLLGVNLGGLGFLTAVTTAELFPSLEMILEGRLKPQERMRLAVRVVREGRPVGGSLVLNDIVLAKDAQARIVELSAAIDGRRLTDYRADGLIVATPTGSTAYNLSAGGPILHPGLKAMIITPICPFTLANRPLVVPGAVELTLRLGPRTQRLHLIGDGQEGLPLGPEDEVVVNQAKGLLLFPSPTADHYAILRTKLGWGSAGVQG